MPGILPMKVIKVGSNSQSRIAQACDRCRSKKIRCDGVTPCCTQCKNVGFECKTSDKLSRRAFPRGYTESLEERVRTLESEVRELKELLDAKDEKIDLLSKFESFSHKRPSVSSTTSSASPAAETPITPKQEPQDNIFTVRQASSLQKSEHRSDPFFVGTSNVRIFIDTVRSKIQENGTCVSNVDATALIGRCDLAKPAKRADLPKNISRLASDQLVNVFFQEWSPLFPVLHRPTFLNIYSDYINDTGVAPNAISIAQLHLVFGIAALASESNKELLSYFEAQWQGALGSVLNETKLATLQCLVLAQLYCIVRGDSNKLVFYSGLAANMSHRLGLHQSQRRFSLSALTCETRKKVFWSLYTLDVFGAISLGLPKLLKDRDIETEQPADVDDENVNEQGFQPTLPGESTKLSSALALFKLARILSKISTELYPATSTYELSLQKIGALSAELDEWRNDLAPHLRLEFAKDKPSTNVISSRCPLLGLFYYYVRMLIHRPVLHSDLSTSTNSSVLAVAESGKHIIQILQLLQERSLSYTICINKPELILTCGFGLMYQMSELSENSKLRKDTQQLMTACVDLLERAGTPAVISFRKIVQLFQPQSERSSSVQVSPKSSQELNKAAKGQLQAINTKLSYPNTKSSKIRDQLSLKTIHINQSGTSLYNAHHGGILTPSRQNSREASASSVTSEPNLKHQTSTSTLSPVSPTTCGGMPNLDYLSFGTPESMTLPGEIKARRDHTAGDWDGLLNSFDPAETVFSSQYPVRHSSDASYMIPPVPLDWHLEWNNPEEWTMFDLTPQEHPVGAKSVLSFSDESTNGEDLSSCDMGSEFRGYSISNEDYYSLQHTTSLASTKA